MEQYDGAVAAASQQQGPESESIHQLGPLYVGFACYMTSSHSPKTCVGLG